VLPLITIEIAEQGNNVRIILKDNGRGIDLAVMAKICINLISSFIPALKANALACS
jgi:DNA topoisomerase VI subunit B